MSASPPKPDSHAAPAGDGNATTGIVGALTRLRAWATGHWLRSLIVAVSILALIGITIGGWAYLASAALQAGQETLDSALADLDQGNYEEARNSVSHMLTSGSLPHSEYGGPLYVLGALKTRDAENQAIPERRRVEYQIASRYLTEAAAYGLPAKLEPQGRFLLGQSLIESGQLENGIEVLNALAECPTPGDDTIVIATQRLLSETYLVLPRPKAKESLEHNNDLLANKSLSADERAAAMLERAECLSRLDQFADAEKAVAEIPPGPTSAAIALMQGKLLLDEVESELHKLPASEREGAVAGMAKKITSAIESLKKANELDETKTHVSKQACYQLARGYSLKGDADSTLKQCARTRQIYGESNEGLAAGLLEANTLRQKGEFEASVLAYRRVLESYAGIPVYRNKLLPADRMREQMMAGLNDYIDQQRFSDALSMLDRFTPLFSRTEQLELRGNLLEKWGNMLIARSAEQTEEPNTLRDEGLQHLRAAGVAFEQLAEARFATKFYTSDLWRGSEDYFQGQSFTHTIDCVHKYLQYEPELRNAQAMLRLGQAHLALGQIPQCISALEECIEFHPLDSSTFQARIDCAKAYWYQGNTDRSEELLRDNIAGSSLKPMSPEWKDSLFELGMLLHEREKFEDAIGTLEEAVQRYPQDPQRMVAQYVIGESYRRWAQELLATAQKTRASSEHDKTVELATKRLNTALSQFEEVQRTITLRTHDIHNDPLTGTMLRNCYMLEGSVLFDLGRYKDAIEAYSNVSSLYPDEPFVLETFVQISNCWRRLNRHDNARGAVRQAQIVLDRLPAESDFASTTVLNRDEWRMVLANMSKW